jgi:hypothetical protein
MPLPVSVYDSTAIIKWHSGAGTRSARLSWARSRFNSSLDAWFRDELVAAGLEQAEVVRRLAPCVNRLDARDVYLLVSAIALVRRIEAITSAPVTAAADAEFQAHIVTATKRTSSCGQEASQILTSLLFAHLRTR